MALAITDVQKAAADTGINAATINNAAVLAGNELDRGANTEVGEVTTLLTIMGFASTPAAGGYVTVALAPLDGTGGTLFSNVVAPAVCPVTADALYVFPVTLLWPPGARYVKPIVGNASGQNTDANAVSLQLLWQAVTV